MLKKKVIASSISNLTDARYFAGWMVDYMIFNIDPTSINHVSPSDIGVFQSWVEGPRFFLSLNPMQIFESEKLLVDLNCQGLILQANSENESLHEFPVILDLPIDSLENYSLSNDTSIEAIVITEIVDVEIALLKCKEFKVTHNFKIDIYIELTSQIISQEQLLDASFDGILVHGSPEEKVGFKSFDELDEIMEVLQDF